MHCQELIPSIRLYMFSVMLNVLLSRVAIQSLPGYRSSATCACMMQPVTQIVSTFRASGTSDEISATKAVAYLAFMTLFLAKQSALEARSCARIIFRHTMDYKSYCSNLISLSSMTRCYRYVSRRLSEAIRYKVQRSTKTTYSAA
jgi:hypothetical protein